MNNFNQALKTAIQGQLAANSIEADKAELIAKGIIDDLCDSFGGRSYYVPNNSDIWIKQRQRKILDDLRNGMHKADVCKKHGITRTWLNKLEKRVVSHESV